MNAALCDFSICDTLEKHLLTYLLTPNICTWQPLLEMSGNVFFNRTPCRSQWFISLHIPADRLSHVLFPIQSVVPVLSRCQSRTSISSHLLLYFINIMKLTAGKLTTNGSLLISKTTEHQIQNTKSKLGHVPPSMPVFLPIVYLLNRLIKLLLVEHGKWVVFTSLPWDSEWTHGNSGHKLLSSHYAP